MVVNLIRPVPRCFPRDTPAFGVGTGTLRLPIPSNCPSGIAALLEACWQRDYHQRPSFRQVRRARPSCMPGSGTGNGTAQPSQVVVPADAALAAHPS